MRKLGLILAVILLIPNQGWAQNNEWIQYINQGEVNCISLEGNTVWIGTDGGFFDKSSETCVLNRKFNLF